MTTAAMPGVAESRVRATRRVLVAVLLVRAAAWGAASTLGVIASIALLDVAIGLPLALRVVLRPTALVAGVGAALAVLLRGRAVLSLERVGLWIEEQVPWLRYALVTAMDPRHAASRPALEPLVGEAAWGGKLAARAARRIAPPLALAAAGWLALLLLPAGAVARVRAPTPGDALDRPAAVDDPRTHLLSPLVAEVAPPAYTRERTRTIDEPVSIAAPEGSRITLRGRGAAARIAATLDDRPLAARDAGSQWSVAFSIADRPAVVRLQAGDESRLVAIEPRPDSAPVVVLSLPQRDSVLAAPEGNVTLAAEARDDHGLARVAFEYIVTSGSGEQFTFRQGTLGARDGGAERRLEMRTTLSLSALELGPGDVVHVRAVARDANGVRGPQTGVSETRALRILRRGEHDTVAVEGAPPPEPDRAALSQRMLILLTEALEARRPSLDRATVVAESRALARDQARLRRLVGEIIFMRLGDDAGGEHAHGPGDGHDHTAEELDRLFSPESLLAAADRATGGRALPEATDFAHGESPVVAINRPLLAAYNHMWDAGRELEVGEPGRALPPMRRALDALQEARAAERYFLRGRPPGIVVDIDRVRLSRREDVTPAPRVPQGGERDDAARRARRYAAAVELLAREPQAAVDSLLLLRVDALGEAPALASALDAAIAALREGRDATPALVRARRAIEGSGAAAAPLGRWSGDIR